MNIQEYLKSNPTRKQVAEMLCRVANFNVLKVDENWLFAELSDKFRLTADDFYNDESELTDYEINCIGLYNWKVR